MDSFYINTEHSGMLDQVATYSYTVFIWYVGSSFLKRFLLEPDCSSHNPFRHDQALFLCSYYSKEKDLISGTGTMETGYQHQTFVRRPTGRDNS
jgi:hypothetical protein